MKRFFATIPILGNVPAVALGLLLAPLMANTAAWGAVPTPSLQLGSVPAPAIELHEGADDSAACAQSDDGCDAGSEVVKERAYLVETAHPGGTMMRQGPAVAIGRLHPEFAARLAAAIREAREAGLTEAGIFSAYRPPAFGVGGFKDKFGSLHAYGLAVDMHGIGSPGSSDAKLWHKVAAKHGVACPYGVNNRAEWNHCQPTRVKVIRSDSPLRKTIVADGPQSPFGMFEAGKALIESVASLFKSFGAPAMDKQEDLALAHASQRTRRTRTAEMSPSRQDRHVRISGRKKQAKKSVETAAAHHKSRNVRHAAKHRDKPQSVRHAAKHRATSMARRAQRASSS